MKEFYEAAGMQDVAELEPDAPEDVRRKFRAAMRYMKGVCEENAPCCECIVRRVCYGIDTTEPSVWNIEEGSEKDVCE